MEKKPKKQKSQKASKLTKKLFYETSRNSSQNLASKIDAFNMGMNSDIQKKWQETMKQSGFEPS